MLKEYLCRSLLFAFYFGTVQRRLLRGERQLEWGIFRPPPRHVDKLERVVLVQRLVVACDLHFLQNGQRTTLN